MISKLFSRTAATVAVCVGALVAAGCSAGTTADSGTGSTGVLNVGYPYAPNDLDPAKINAAMEWYADLAYDPLIYLAPNGRLQPRLATSWGYVGADNTQFDLRLRANTEFSDGSPLTAAVVKSNIDYFRQAGGATAPYLAPIQSIDTPDPLTVHIVLSQPDPLLPQIFTQEFQAGNVTSGPALAAPQTMATQTFGAGQYMLDTAATVSGDHYTFVPNPHYWNKSAVHYSRIVVHVLANPNTALAALKTGQVQVIQGDYSTADSASSAGLTVASDPEVFQGLALADRSGTVVRALGDVRVRQALNYAVDRQKISSALLGRYGTPTEEIAMPGGDGYSATHLYSYDPAKAKSLLAQAGYANGFTLPVLNYESFNTVTQAIADELKAVGVTLQLTNDSDPTQYLRDMDSQKYAAYAIGFGSQPIFVEGPQLFLPSATQFNPFHSTDPQIQSLYNQAAAAAPAQRSTLDQQIVQRIDQQGWFVPVTTQPVVLFAKSTVAGVQATASTPSGDPVEWHSAS
ncbi:MAG TPA: ABC transporter substrate-binding protein [Pseudonocardiaceae bacterium]|nr:ABC transporter substrate-binding protein [Pseudonocardiaceae bacterium]